MSAGTSLEAVLEARERRSRRRAELAAMGTTVVQLTISAPGPRKDGEEIRKAARFGAELLERAFTARGLRALHGESLDGEAGPCRFWVVDAAAAQVKSVAAGLEDGYSLGRLWDFDVYGSGGSKLDRESVGSAARRCYLCGSPAAVCSGRRVHGTAEVERRFREMLERGIEEMESKGVFA